MNPSELEQAIQDAFDGELDDARAASLREALMQSPEAMDAYCDHALLETELRRHASGRSRISSDSEAGLRALPKRKSRVIVWALSAVAVLLLAGLISRLVFHAPDQVFARIEVSPDSILKHDDGSVFGDAILRKDQTLVIGQGVVKLDFGSGVQAVVDGPATLKLVAAGKLELQSGHSWFNVPENARGFQVVTPGFEVTDLGTEFGIDLREDRPAQVHVLKGLVETVSLTGDRQKISLHAGEAATLTADGRWQEFPSAPGKFRSQLPKSAPFLKMDFDHLVSDNLAITGDILGVKDSVARVIRPELVRFVPGVVGNAIEFNGDGASIETTWEGISGSEPRTVSLWCKMPRNTSFTTAPPLAWWGNPTTGWNKKFKVALITNPKAATVLRASFGDLWVDGNTNLADDAWHHLAVVYRGNLPEGGPDLSFFIDGKPEGISRPQSEKSPIDTDTRSDNAGCLAIGKYELPAGGRNPFLRATLDELQIFEGALDDEKIRDLARQR